MEAIQVIHRLRRAINSEIVHASHLCCFLFLAVLRCCHERLEDVPNLLVSCPLPGQGNSQTGTSASGVVVLSCCLGLGGNTGCQANKRRPHQRRPANREPALAIA